VVLTGHGQYEETLPSGRFRSVTQHTGLADPGLSADQDQATLFPSGLSEESLEAGRFRFPPHRIGGRPDRRSRACRRPQVRRDPGPGGHGANLVGPIRESETTARRFVPHAVRRDLGTLEVGR
jgi:hypothetical protein